MMIFKSGDVIVIQALYWTLTYTGCRGSHTADPWYEFKEKFGKTYATQSEEHKRKHIFFENLRKINHYNDRNKGAGRTFELGVNELADLTANELPKGLRPYDSSPFYHGWRGLGGLPIQFEATGVKLPDHVDWREKGVVTPVKHQHNCLACYSFVAVDAMESQYFLKTGKHISLSQQQIIDCSKLEGNLGCKGGMVDWAYKYILRAKGVEKYEDYPFVLKKSKCTFNSSKIAMSITNYGEIKNGSEVSLQEAIAFYGPISASIASNDFAWNYYTDGVYDNPDCPTEVDHAVLVVGYGTEDDIDYWLVKSSYGESFGDRGYIKMARNKGNQCAIASYANFPILGKWKQFSPKKEPRKKK
uniref:Cathepsin S n=1 Tax=Lygus hesperus TaxID=30085 RepID=A0A0A9X4Z5_LYGHE